MKEIEFNTEPVLSWKIYLDMIILKWKYDLEKYIKWTKITALGITWMRMPVYKLTWKFWDEVFDLITNYTKENFEPYIDTVETSTEIPKLKE